MAHAVAVVVKHRMLTREPPGLLVEIRCQPVRVNKRFEHRRMTILIRISVFRIQRRDEEPGKARRIRLLPALRRRDDDPSLRGETLDELTTRARHIEND